MVLCQQGQKHEGFEEGSSNHCHAGDLAALKGSRCRMDIMCGLAWTGERRSEPCAAKSCDAYITLCSDRPFVAFLRT